jgi:uncharacterized repeat protein (TIGR01451 family)
MVLATAATSGALVVSSAAPAGASSTVTVNAAVDSPGNDTGLNVQGSVTITAIGSWSYDGIHYNGPGGIPCCTNSQFLNPSAQAQSLLGRIGTTGVWTEVDGGPTTLSGNGELYLAMNDAAGTFGDNVGSLDATLFRSGEQVTCPTLNNGAYYGTFSGDASGTSSDTFNFTPNGNPHGNDLTGFVTAEPFFSNAPASGSVSCGVILFGDVGSSVQFTGSFSGDANTISGTWESGGFSGTFELYWSLGGLSMNDYCEHLGYFGNTETGDTPSTQLKGEISGSPGDAYDNWACQDPTQTPTVLPLANHGPSPSMDDACAFQNGDPGFGVYGQPSDPDDAFSWHCFPASLTTLIHGPTTATVGDDIAYTVTVNNNGQIDAPDSEVDVSLPGEVVNPPEGCTGGEGNVLTCDVGVISPGDETSFVITVSTTGLNPGLITTSASVFPAIHGQAAGVSFDTDLEAAGPSLTTTVTSAPTSVTAGQNVQYKVTVTNQGGTDVPAVQTIDTIPDGTTLVSAPGCSGSHTLTCTLGTISAGASASATIVVKTATIQAGAQIHDDATTSPGGSSGTATTQVVAPTPGTSSGFVAPGGSLSSGGTNPAVITLPNTGNGTPVSIIQGSGGFCSGQCSGPVTNLGSMPGYTDPQHPVRLTLTFKDLTYWTAWSDFKTSTIFKRSATGVTGFELPDCADNPAWTAAQKAAAAQRRTDGFGTQSGIANPSPCVDARNVTPLGLNGPYAVSFVVNMLSGDPGIGRRACSQVDPCNSLNPPTSVTVTPSTFTNTAGALQPTVSVTFTPGTNTTPPAFFQAQCGSDDDDQSVGIFTTLGLPTGIKIVGPSSGPAALSAPVLGHRYQCVVQALDSNLQPSANSPLSWPVAVGGPTAVPTAVKATSGSAGTTGPLNVAFTPVSGFSSYTATCMTPATGSSVVTTTGTTVKTVVTTATGTTVVAQESVGGASSPIQVPGLTTGKVYVCSVAATNANGPGKASVAAPAVGVGTPAAPAKPVVQRTASGSVKVTYLLPANNGSTVLNYTVTCTSGTLTKTPLPVTALSITVTGLTSGRSYTCTVKAKNGRGLGLPSPASLAVTA